MGNSGIFWPDEIPEKVNNILNKYKAVSEGDKIVAILSGGFIWGLGSCLIATEKEFVHFDNCYPRRYAYTDIGSIGLVQNGFIKNIVCSYGLQDVVIDFTASLQEIEQFYKALVDKYNSVLYPEVQYPSAEKDDFTDQLRKLAALRDEGIITEDEFTAKKRQILGI